MSGINLMLVGSGPGRVTAAATISANTSNYTVNTAKAPGYAAGTTDFTLTINSNIFVSSTSTGSYAMTVDTSWAAGDTVTIINNGTIVGRGGNGGQGGGTGGTSGVSGSSAGPALIVNRAITFNNTNGRIAGGGGGGGGGTYGVNNDGSVGKTTIYTSYGGGGGGGGIGVSSGGAGGPTNGGAGPGYVTGNAGAAGTLTAAGAGGATIGLNTKNAGGGGAGGGYGSSGTSGTNTGGAGVGGGGAAGACIVGNANITYAGTGTRNGSIS